MDERDHLLRLVFPCPGCDYNVVVQAVEGIRRCPECGCELPDVADHPQPMLAWDLLTQRQPDSAANDR